MPPTSKNATGAFVDYPRSEIEQSITDRFEVVAAHAAERIAIRRPGGGLTYDELNRSANGVARAILNLGRSGAEPVVLFLDHYERAISAILGVLKTGKFYVPLDPSYPAERLSSVLDDCKPGVIITESQCFSRARDLAPPGCRVVDVDDMSRSPSSENPGVPVSPGALAAVFYTSGSTGRPKGVMQSHRLVLHRVMVDTNRFRICPDDRLSLLSSPGYSVSLRHLFGALLNGASVCPFNLAGLGLTELADWLERERITVYFSVASVFRQLASTARSAEAFRSIRLLHVGSEPVMSSDFELYKKLLPPHCLFVNSLASNETGILTVFVADKGTPLTGPLVPVGYEVDDKEILIVDDNNRKVGANQLGQIVVRSKFLSPGYWARDDLTAAAFRPDPHSRSKRLFRTGDLGRKLPNGCLLYAGRADFRANIRGIRVEVEEVEGALRAHPKVNHAVVVAHEDGRGEHRLAAYVVLEPGSVTTAGELRTCIAAQLPEYMLPSTFTFLDALPQTAHGKVDRKRLPAPDHTRRRVAAEFVPPQDDAERELTGICESILSVHPIGVRDNLFELGLESLTLLRLTAQCEKRFRTSLPPASLFASPTIAQLASLLRDPHLGSWSSLVRVQTGGAKPPFFWIHGDGSAPFLARHLGPDQPVYALEHQSQDGRPAAHTDIEGIATYYLQEIRRVQPRGPYFVGGYSFGGVVALELAQQVTRQGEEVGLLALLDPPSLVTRQVAGSRRASGVRKGQRLSSLVARITRLGSRLSALTPRERLAYLQPRIVQYAAGILKIPAVKKAATRATYKLYLALGRPLPLFVRSRYILDLYVAAQRLYAGQPYCGRVLLFRGRDREYHSCGDWKQLLPRTSESHVIDAVHKQMREEPYIHLWAETLNVALSRAQHDVARRLSTVGDVTNAHAAATR